MLVVAKKNTRVLHCSRRVFIVNATRMLSQSLFDAHLDEEVPVGFRAGE